MAGGTAGAGPFGVELRRWRRHRGLSQLSLAAAVGSTGRHLSFLETGRSRPSRQMVLRLGDALQVSLRQRNQLLHAAGLPGAFPESDLDGVDVAPWRAALDRLLNAHLPYPAMVVDRYWTVVMANAAGTTLYGADVVGTNVVHRFLADPAARHAIVNWPDVAWAGLDRLTAQARREPFDSRIADLVRLAEKVLEGVPRPRTDRDEPVLCPWFRIGDQVVRTIGIAARFDPITDVTLDELRVELSYPLDADAECFFRQAHRARGDSADGGTARP